MSRSAASHAMLLLKGDCKPSNFFPSLSYDGDFHCYDIHRCSVLQYVLERTIIIQKVYRNYLF